MTRTSSDIASIGTTFPIQYETDYPREIQLEESTEEKSKAPLKEQKDGELKGESAQGSSKAK